MSEYTFTTDWFTRRIPKLSQHLLRYAGTPTKYLEIGVYEGRSAAWFLETILTHEDSKATLIDPFYGNAEHAGENKNLYEVCTKNLERFGDKVDIIRGRSQEVVRTFKPVPTYDIIYIDGDHSAAAVLEDAFLSFPLLKVGGILVFDDYPWANAPKTYLRPKAAVDAFLESYPHRLKVLHKGWHVIIKKIDPIE